MKLKRIREVWSASQRALSFAVLLGLVVIGPSCFAQQNPNGVLPLSTTAEPYLFLVRDPVVHKELELTEEQQQKLQALNDRVDMSMWTRQNKQPQKRTQITQQATTETKAAVREFLSKAQIRRIAQIELWVLGMKSLLKENVAKGMGLETQQRDEIRQIVLTAQIGMGDLRRQLNAGGDADELNKQFRELQVNQQSDIIALLSEEQKKKWVKALGNQIDTSKLGRIKFKAPEIDHGAGWVNSDPLSMEELKGKVVALHFYAFQ